MENKTMKIKSVEHIIKFKQPGYTELPNIRYKGITRVIVYERGDETKQKYYLDESWYSHNRSAFDRKHDSIVIPDFKDCIGDTLLVATDNAEYKFEITNVYQKWERYNSKEKPVITEQVIWVFNKEFKVYDEDDIYHLYSDGNRYCSIETRVLDGQL